MHLADTFIQIDLHCKHKRKIIETGEWNYGKESFNHLNRFSFTEQWVYSLYQTSVSFL